MKFILLAFTVLSVFSCKSVTRDQPRQSPPVSNVESAVKITGRVGVYGNEPHTFVGIVDEKGVEYAVYPPAQEAELRRLQGHLIEFTVIMLDEPKGEGGLYLKGGTVTPVKWEIIR